MFWRKAQTLIKGGKNVSIIRGSIERIVYHNEQNNYVIARFLKEDEDLVTIIGFMPNATNGIPLELTGEWVFSRKYGSQFKVNSYKNMPPKTPEGVKKYLGSGLIKGIGPVMAGRIVDVFGTSALDIIEESPERLSEVNGIGEKRIQMIIKSIEIQKDVQEVMLFLQSYLPGIANATKVYKHYGKDSINVVSKNPYILAAEVRGIGFKTSDQIAAGLGFEKNSSMRVKEGTYHVLYEHTNLGHVYCEYKKLCQTASTLLEVDYALVENSLELLQSENRVFVEKERVYPAPHYQAEINLAKNLISLQSSPRSIRSIDSKKAIEWAESKLSIVLADKQRDAVVQATRSKVSVITGGPGTGKTTIIQAILKIFENITKKIVLAAPTGRAAKRMEELTGRTSQTIHRLLEFNPQKGGFVRTKNNPLDADIIIIDESSMVDLFLMHNLVKAIHPQSTLILVGDINQLPPVGPGNILKDIIDSRAFPVTILDKVFRQSLQSKIVVNAHKINSGNFPDIKNESGDFYFIKEDEHEKIPEIIVDLCKQRLPNKFNLNFLKDIQVLSPMHKGLTGVENINSLLQKELNPRGIFISRGKTTYRVGDKVMQIRNNYELNVFNGDIGTISYIDKDDQVVKVKYDNKIVDYDYGNLDEIVLAYAISVHKSQGSEYSAVIMPITTQHYILLQRNLLYTAITRGKKLVVLIGTPKAIAIAVKNNKPQMRLTKLKERLIFEFEKTINF